MPVGMGSPAPQPAAPVAPPPVAKAAKGGKGKKPKGEGGSKKMLILIIIGILLVLGSVTVAAWAVFWRDSAAGVPVEVPAKKPGVTVELQPKSVNLTDGHYLRIAVSVTFVAEKEEASANAPNTAPAYDAIYDIYLGKDMEKVTSPAGRDEFRKKLLERLNEVYEDKVYAVYFNDYVTQ